MIKQRIAAAGAATALILGFRAGSAQAFGFDSGGPKSCAGTNPYLGIQFRGAYILKVWTSGSLRQTYSCSRITRDWYESGSRSITRWRVEADDSLNTSNTYPYCYNF